MKLPVTLTAALAWAVMLHAGKYNTAVEIGMPAPTFQKLPGIDGKTYSLSDFKEDALVLVFLANHCPWVRGGEKDLIQLVNDYKGKSVRIIGLGVNLRPDDVISAMKEHAAKAGYNFLYLHDASQEIGRKYGATRTPEYFVLDKQRLIVYTGLLHNSPALAQQDGSVRYTNGEPTEHYVRNAINAVLASQHVPAAETRAQGCTVEYSTR